jgi:hypothetical protein
MWWNAKTAEKAKTAQLSFSSIIPYFSELLYVTQSGLFL